MGVSNIARAAPKTKGEALSRPARFGIRGYPLGHGEKGRGISKPQGLWPGSVVPLRVSIQVACLKDFLPSIVVGHDVRFPP